MAGVCDHSQYAASAAAINHYIDREADALYLDLDEAPAVDSEEISPGVILDYNADGKVVGLF